MRMAFLQTDTFGGKQSPQKVPSGCVLIVGLLLSLALKGKF